MSERIFTLFGEEIVPEQPKAQHKPRAKKKKDDTTGEPAAEHEEVTPSADAAAQPEAIATNTPGEQAADTTIEVPETPGNDPVSSDTHPEADVANATPVAVLATETPEPEIKKEEELAPTAENSIVPTVTEAEIQEPADAVEASATAPEGIETDVVAETAEQAEEQPKKTRKGKEVVTPDEPTGDKQYYSIGEVAELFKVKTSHIRFWTTEFKLKVRTTRKGDRLYSNEAIKELRAIHHLVKERGFTLAGAKVKLKEQKQVEVEAVDLKKSLTQLRNKLVAIKNQLK